MTPSDDSPNGVLSGSSTIGKEATVHQDATVYGSTLSQDYDSLGIIGVSNICPIDPVLQNGFRRDLPERNSLESFLENFPHIELSERLGRSDDNEEEDHGLGDRLSSCEGHGWQSPLHMAAQKGNDKIMRMLLQQNTNCDEKDSDGLTPLIQAVIVGHEDVVNVLVSHGARIGEVDNLQRSALHWAIIYRRGNILETLLARCKGQGALIDSYDNKGRTPLHLAIDAGYEAGVKIMLEFGANASCKTVKILNGS